MGRLVSLLGGCAIAVAVSVPAWAGPQEDLSEAVRTGNSAAVMAAVNKGANPNVVLDYGSYQTRVLPWAARFGNLTLIQFLLGKGVDVNGISPSDNRYSAAMRAAEYNQLATLQLLASYSANLNYQSDKLTNALSVAISNGHTEVVQWLIEQGCVFLNSKSESPLHKAVMGRHTAVIAVLLKDQSRLKIKMSTLDSVLDLITRTGSPQQLQLFLTHLNQLPRLREATYGPRLLSSAVAHFNLAIAEWLLAQQVNPNVPNEKGLSPLQVLALSETHGEVAALIGILLAHGADARALLPEQLITLDREHPDVPADLFEKALQGMSLSVRNAAGQTLLHQSVAGWSPGLAAYLVKQGMSLEDVDNSGSTPLLVIFSQHQITDVGDYEGDEQISTLAEFEAAQFKRLMTVLLAHNPNLNAVNKKGQTILHVLFAAYSNAGYLPEKGINGEVRNAAIVASMELILAKGISLSVGTPLLKERVVEYWMLKGLVSNPLLQLFLTQGAKIDPKDPLVAGLGANVFKDGTDRGKRLVIPLLEQLVSKGMPLNVAKQSPALWAALSHNHPTALQWLLNKGVPVNVLDMNKNTHQIHSAVHEAVYQGHPELLKILLLYNPKLDIKDANGQTPLAMAEAAGKEEMAKLLKAAGAKP